MTLNVFEERYFKNLEFARMMNYLVTWLNRESLWCVKSRNGVSIE